jgi:hypothetical protein
MFSERRCWKFKVFCNVMPCPSTFREIIVRSSGPEEEGSTNIRNVAKYPFTNTEWHRRTLNVEASCLYLQKNTNYGNKRIHPSPRNSVVSSSLFGKPTFINLNKKKITFFLCSSSFALNPVMWLHLLPVEAVDFLTLIFKIHFNIIFHFCLRVTRDFFWGLMGSSLVGNGVVL